MNSNVDEVLSKAKLLGKRMDIIGIDENTYCTLIYINDKFTILCIPDNVTVLDTSIYRGLKINNTGMTDLRVNTNMRDRFGYTQFYQCIKHLKGKLKVIGGRSLKSMEHMFYECEADSIDISCLNTGNVTSMRLTFGYCKAEEINLGNIDTHNVINMYGMFHICKVHDLDISTFKTSKVTNMNNMFSYCRARKIDISHFDITNVKDMQNMFFGCQADEINVSNINIQSAYLDSPSGTLVDDMFTFCRSKIIANNSNLLKFEGGN